MLLWLLRKHVNFHLPSTLLGCGLFDRKLAMQWYVIDDCQSTSLILI
jgi:hypothetical protein